MSGKGRRHRRPFLRMQIDFSKNHFELFHLPVAFTIDLQAIERAYREVQREVHPDRFANTVGAEQRLAAQWSTQVNEAYRTLKSPLARGRYFLKIHGHDTEEETNTSMPLDFLTQQMEWREAVVAANAKQNSGRLDELSREHAMEEKRLFMLLAAQLDDASHHVAAKETVRKLRFLEKLGEELDDALSQLEA